MWGMHAAGEIEERLVGALENPGLLLGIPLALAGAVFMSLGAQYQHRGVEKVERLSGAGGDTGLSLQHLRRLLTRPSWVIGTLMLAFAVVCQLGALSVAPLIVVQPLGAVALVITTLLNARVSGHAPTRRSLTAIGLCVGGIFVFVAVAAAFAVERELTQNELLIVLAILLLTIILLGGGWLIMRHRMTALFYIVGAGVLYGFVATLAKIVIKRLQSGNFGWITLVCVVALVAAAIVGGYFVQTAYSSGPPDLVIAGLTVIDPIVAVLIGSLVLGEADASPLWALIVFVVAGAVATIGVVQLARYHPQVLSESQELEIRRQRSRGGEGSPPSVGDGTGRVADDAHQHGTGDRHGSGEGTEPPPYTGSTPLDELRNLRDPDDLASRPRRPPEEPPPGDADR